MTLRRKINTSGFICAWQKVIHGVMHVPLMNMISDVPNAPTLCHFSSSVISLVRLFWPASSSLCVHSCFLSLLLVAAVVWKIKQSCWASRRREVSWRPVGKLTSKGERWPFYVTLKLIVGVFTWPWISWLWRCCSGWTGERDVKRFSVGVWWDITTSVKRLAPEIIYEPSWSCVGLPC